MPVHLSVQLELDPKVDSQEVIEHIPSDEQFEAWAKAAQLDSLRTLELNLRVVNAAEIHALNLQFRSKDQATNVLSFASQVPPGSGIDVLGDIIICAEIVAQESEKYGKDLTHRWAHMMVHACLHVQGLDHVDTDDRENMENQEIRILKALGISDPYQVN